MTHVCSCGDCSVGYYEDRCKYEEERDRLRIIRDAATRFAKAFDAYDDARTSRYSTARELYLDACAARDDLNEYDI